MANHKLRTLIENIVIEALEEWMTECECEEQSKDNSTGIRSFGSGKVEKSKKITKK